MNLFQAKLNAETQLSKHPALTGWVFKWKPGNSSVFGVCSYQRRVIYLQPRYVALRTEAEVQNTVLHEIAHALVGTGHHHDNAWRAKAAELGCTTIAARSDAALNEAHSVDPELLRLYNEKRSCYIAYDRKGVSHAQRAIRRYLRKLS